ncbi:MAG: hypothetical protein IPG74_11475 [Flavobacteriales bacterium]|nr:hypothetical protein [Flavobacteriales bacterium]MBK7554821.1 hypothetical protein [Flavobacteriales bacterium]MBK9196246.1 hypothetical protein [Flavobacteriales bacterium]MBP6573902.1 hypothetical protein [Flavobacteriales bacterium]
MTAPRPFSLLAGTIALLAAVFVLNSCNKVEPTKAIITVVDEDSQPVAGAYVKLFANPTYPLGDPSRLLKEGNTDASGIIVFDYSDFYKQGQAGFAVLDIFASYDTLAAEGIIKILEEEENEETVVLVPVTI